MEILPCLLAYSKEEFDKKISLIRQMNPVGVQVDVMDGKFVPNTTYAPAHETTQALHGIPFEIDLMVADPVSMIHEWLATPAMRLIFHIESGGIIDELLEKVHHAGREVGLSLNPETPLEQIDSFVGEIDEIQVMGNTPGAAGKIFLPEMYDRIRTIRSCWPNLAIEVDIGVNKDTIQLMKSAGATRVTATSAIFSENDPVEAYQRLAALAGHETTK